jgi:hypothetical protein
MSAVDERATDRPETRGVANASKQDVPRHVRSEDASLGQKTDGVNETSNRRHSEEDIGSDFLRGWITACRGVIHHACRKILSGVDLFSSA